MLHTWKEFLCVRPSPPYPFQEPYLYDGGTIDWDSMQDRNGTLYSNQGNLKGLPQINVELRFKAILDVYLKYRPRMTVLDLSIYSVLPKKLKKTLASGEHVRPSCNENNYANFMSLSRIFHCTSGVAKVSYMFQSCKWVFLLFFR